MEEPMEFEDEIQLKKVTNNNDVCTPVDENAGQEEPKVEGVSDSTVLKELDMNVERAADPPAEKSKVRDVLPVLPEPVVANSLEAVSCTADEAVDVETPVVADGSELADVSKAELEGQTRYGAEKRASKRNSIVVLPEAANDVSKISRSSSPVVKAVGASEPPAVPDVSSAVTSETSEVQPVRRRGPKKRGHKRKLNSGEPTEPPQEYEVEKILSHLKQDDKIVAYQVKWVGWSDEHNTFEPVDNLRTSLAMIADYHQNRIYPGRGELVFKSHVETLRIELSQLDEKTIEEFCLNYLTETGHNITLNEKEVEDNLIVLSRIPPFARDAKMVKDVKVQLQLLEFKKRRERQLNTLKTWEAEINLVSTDVAPISIFNGVDLDVISPNFHYVNYVVPDVDVEIPENNPLSCECVGSCLQKKCCWFGQWEECPYTKDGRLRYARGTPIYECNKNCKCDSNCGNRILQNGRTVPVAVFKTNNGSGWGVRTLAPIKKGQFVVEYVGEVVNLDVAEHRGRTYDRIGCTYLFDLDFNDQDQCPFTVDAAYYGNVSHFINHSCDPNLAVFAVWVDCLDRNLPRLGLYASRNIKAFEELSFDYMLELNSPKKRKDDKQMVCRCNAKHCRMMVF